VGAYELPEFPLASVPTEAQFADALTWAMEKGLVTTSASYAESVNAGFLP
jgi:hypothetical protein